ncbi:hypothetical protein HHI36_009406, partial [Cryptolaemus montrouzieri]
RIFREALDDKAVGVIVAGVTVKDLQELVTSVSDHSKSMGIKLNAKKTKWLAV